MQHKTKSHKIHTNKSTHSEMGPVWQNPIQRTVRTAHISVLITVHSFSTHSSDNLPSFLQTNIIAPMLSIGGEGLEFQEATVTALRLLYFKSSEDVNATMSIVRAWRDSAGVSNQKQIQKMSQHSQTICKGKLEFLSWTYTHQNNFDDHFSISSTHLPPKGFPASGTFSVENQNKHQSMSNL